MAAAQILSDFGVKTFNLPDILGRQAAKSRHKLNRIGRVSVYAFFINIYHTKLLMIKSYKYEFLRLGFSLKNFTYLNSIR